MAGTHPAAVSYPPLLGAARLVKSEHLFPVDDGLVSAAEGGQFAQRLSLGRAFIGIGCCRCEALALVWTDHLNQRAERFSSVGSGRLRRGRHLPLFVEGRPPPTRTICPEQAP
jgi:hypothetical protein